DGGRSSPILYRRRGADGSPHYVWSEEGTIYRATQRAAGPSLFCLGLNACLDDITVLLDSESALKAFKLCQVELKTKFNLGSNVKKSKLVPNGDTPAPVP
ncbi:unnamed protein product, partial [Heterosigma akashiwo]